MINKLIGTSILASCVLSVSCDNSNDPKAISIKDLKVPSTLPPNFGAEWKGVAPKNSEERQIYLDTLKQVIQSPLNEWTMTEKLTEPDSKLGIHCGLRTYLHREGDRVSEVRCEIITAHGEILGATATWVWEGPGGIEPAGDKKSILYVNGGWGSLLYQIIDGRFATQRYHLPKTVTFHEDGSAAMNLLK